MASRFDYQWLDAEHRRLYIAHLGDNSLLVFDLEGQRVVQEIPGIPAVHGVLAAPDQHLVFATATKAKTLALIHSVAELGRGFLGPNAHSVSVDAATHRVYFPLESVHGRPTLRVMQPKDASVSK